MRYGAASARPKWGLVGAGLIVVAITYIYLVSVGVSGVRADQSTGLSSNALFALVGTSVGVGLMITGVIHQFSTSTYALIPLAIAINIIVGQIVVVAKIPFVYLDSIGTILVAVLAGPWAGAVTGGLANVIWGFFNPVALPFSIVAMAIGLISGWFGRLGWFRRFYLPPIAGLACGVITAVLSAPLSAFIYGGVTGAGTDALVALFRAGGASPFVSSLSQGLITDPTDKIVSFIVAYLILIALPPRIRSRFGQGDAVDINR